MTENGDPELAKRELRRVMKQRRAAARAENPQSGFALRDIFLRTIEVPARAVVAGYVAHDDELDPNPLLEELHRRGHALCLPVTAGKNNALIFRAYAPGDRLVRSASLPVMEPVTAAAIIEPDVVLVPLLAFDLCGHRVGFGGGYYDRTLTALRKQRKLLAIGIGFECQHTTEIPATSYDARLDKIVTETQAHLHLRSV
jgi:5-formyltetrahydrofolate cyclo-ligase